MTSSPIRIRALPGGSHRRQVARDLTLPESTPEAELTFELVRAIAWAASRGRAPVAGHVLVDRITEALVPVSGNPLTRIRETAETAVAGLAAAGDLADLGGGQWVCVPAHIVTTPDSQPDLLVSGLPLRALEPALRRQLVAHGPARRLAAAPSGLPVISFSTWTRRPQEPLREWTQRTLAATELHDSDPLEVLTTRPVFYHPGPAAENRPQVKRWRPPGSDLHGRHLARTTSLTSSVDYQLCELDRGRLVGSWPCDSDTARRLMYGIDLISGSPTYAKARRSRKDFTIQTTNPLPRAEARILLALARQARSREWVMTADYPSACPVLGELGIEVISW